MILCPIREVLSGCSITVYPPICLAVSLCLGGLYIVFGRWLDSGDPILFDAVSLPENQKETDKLIRWAVFGLVQLSTDPNSTDPATRLARLSLLIPRPQPPNPPKLQFQTQTQTQPRDRPESYSDLQGSLAGHPLPLLLYSTAHCPLSSGWLAAGCVRAWAGGTGLSALLCPARHCSAFCIDRQKLVGVGGVWQPPHTHTQRASICRYTTPTHPHTHTHASFDRPSPPRRLRSLPKCSAVLCKRLDHSQSITASRVPSLLTLASPVLAPRRLLRPFFRHPPGLFSLPYRREEIWH